MAFPYILLLGLVILIILAIRQAITRANMSPAERAEQDFGPLNRKLICPHCQTTAQVRTKPIQQKKGVSGGKATAALLTGGISMLATGLSRTEAHTQAHCMNCESTWVF